MMRAASATGLVLAFLCWCSGALGEAELAVKHLEDDFMQDLLDRGLQDAIPVLKDNGVTAYSSFSTLKEGNFAEMDLKLGHRMVLSKWWKALNGDIESGLRSQVKQQTAAGVAVDIRNYHDGYPSPTATHGDWGAPEYKHCVQPYTWPELTRGYMNMSSSSFFKTGGLGKLLEDDGYETWQCVHGHYCATGRNDSWFCFVYHETDEVFTPWGENARLKLVKVEEPPPPKKACTPWVPMEPTGVGSVCDVCLEGYTGPDGGPCVPCAAGTYKNVPGSSPCMPCANGTSSDAGSQDIADCTCNAGLIGPIGGPGGPCKIPDTDCSSQPCVEYPKCHIEPVQRRKMDSQNYELPNDDVESREKLKTEDQFNAIMGATFERKVVNGVTMWHSDANGGTTLCHPVPYDGTPATAGKHIWNIASGGLPCSIELRFFVGYVGNRKLLDTDVAFYWPDNGWIQTHGKLVCPISF